MLRSPCKKGDLQALLAEIDDTFKKAKLDITATQFFTLTELSIPPFKPPTEIKDCCALRAFQVRDTFNKAEDEGSDESTATAHKQLKELRDQLSKLSWLAKHYLNIQNPKHITLKNTTSNEVQRITCESINICQLFELALDNATNETGRRKLKVAAQDAQIIHDLYLPTLYQLGVPLAYSEGSTCWHVIDAVLRYSGRSTSTENALRSAINRRKTQARTPVENLPV